MWRRVFGEMIREILQAGDCSVEEAAHRSGMEISARLAIEAGYVPADPFRLRSMAAALEIGFEQLATMVSICQGAWLS
jgi:transcriptional regulator with XRE-family HTH domain